MSNLKIRVKQNKTPLTFEDLEIGSIYKYLETSDIYVKCNEGHKNHQGCMSLSTSVYYTNSLSASKIILLGLGLDISHDS